MRFSSTETKTKTYRVTKTTFQHFRPCLQSIEACINAIAEHTYKQRYESSGGLNLLR